MKFKPEMSIRNQTNPLTNHGKVLGVPTQLGPIQLVSQLLTWEAGTLLTEGFNELNTHMAVGTSASGTYLEGSPNEVQGKRWKKNVKFNPCLGYY
ncbi:hypothetical protein NPIL_12721 [Nephila pilipes]|uniref:Uncharacterized protein n=1 Tax=Nephila pilipes TaxID=299642 RepID=A0A8X6TCW7_NEPPI|nr:hypothetical protein NPIL_12721 [Nephila pilipes]